MLYRNAKDLGQRIMSLLDIVSFDRKNDGNTYRDGIGSAADEIMKYKAMLDSGAITEEEFAAKKAAARNMKKELVINGSS